MKQKIKTIIFEEFHRILTSITQDFSKNYLKKRNNFLLNQFNEKTMAQMVFTSSFESKCGFAIEACAQRIARLKFGSENVPTIVNPRNLPYNIDFRNTSGQIVITDVDSDNGNLRGEIAAFRANNVSRGRGKNYIPSNVTQETIQRDLLPLSQKYKTKFIHTKPVDLAFWDGENWNIMEIKAGGDLDTSNAPSNVEKLLNIYVDMGIANCKVYFATLYNKDGEGNTWKGSVKKHLNYPSMFLVGSQFWNKILPCNIDFHDFEHIYYDALVELNFDKHINDMLNAVMEKKLGQINK